MKTLTLLFIFIFALSAFGQEPAASDYKGVVRTDGKGIADNSIPYVNVQHDFLFIPPPESKQNKYLNSELESLVTFSCPHPECNPAGVFSLIKIIPVKSSVAEMVTFLQQKSFQAEFSSTLISAMKPENNATVLSALSQKCLRDKRYSVSSQFLSVMTNIIHSI